MGLVRSVWQLGLCRRDSSAPLRCAQNDMGRGASLCS